MKPIEKLFRLSYKVNNNNFKNMKNNFLKSGVLSKLDILYINKKFKHIGE